MCRIAGMLNKAMPAEEITGIVQKMCDLQIHGGPDDGGIYTSVTDNLVLGNRRLALLDLSAAGHQPMCYNDRFHITYNGELYNYISLKEELKCLGYQFNTHTDTEVILAAFSHWNTLAFARFSGMFAFAIWDNLLKELFLVRDTAGIKPLYYSTVPGSLAFASEIRAFQPVPFLKESNRSWPVYLMAYGHIPEPATTLRHVKPLPKGFFLKVEAVTGKQSLQSFNHYSYNHKYPAGIDVNTSLAGKLKRAVESHLVADAPVGVFLSGGLDSGIIASVAADIRKSRLSSLSLYFEDEYYSEKKYQDILLKQLRCEPHQYLLKETEFHEQFPLIIKDMDMPGCDGINTWFISKLAKQQGLKAVLSGIGADELFGGYPSFKRLRIATYLQHIPNPLIRAGQRNNIKRFNRLAYLQLQGIKGIYLFLRGQYTPNEIARQLNASEKEVWNILDEMPVFGELNDIQSRNRASWMEMNLYMQNQLLRDADVMGMAHGVEIRVPFLDDQFIRFALSIDPAIKYSGEHPKQILIESYKAELPEPIWNRPKMGFSFPFQQWFTNSVFIKDLMYSGDQMMKMNYDRFLQGKSHWSNVMSLVLLNNRNEKE